MKIQRALPDRDFVRCFGHVFCGDWPPAGRLRGSSWAPRDCLLKMQTLKRLNCDASLN